MELKNSINKKNVCIFFGFRQAFEAHTAERSIQMDTIAIDNVPSINRSFPKIDNFEYFPSKVLLQIFIYVDDTALLNLAETSYRFEGIAKIVFKRRYANGYFVVDGESNSQKAMYSSFFSRFGEYADIRSIEVKHIQDIDKNHWLSQFLQKHTKHLERLKFDGCTFLNLDQILSQHMKITHLIFKNDFHKEIELPEYRSLMKLDLSCSISFASLKQVIENNPQLESLLLRDCCEIASFREIILFIADHLKHLKELAVVNLNNFDWENSPPDETIDKIVNCLRCLEFLALGTDPQIIGLLQRLSFECQNIKHLEIDQIGENLCDEMLETLCAFDKIETLSLSQPWYDDAIESSLIAHLPNLRHLSLSMSMPNTHAYVLSLLRKCSTLEKFTIDINVNRPDSSQKLYANLYFFNKFRENVCQNRNVRIEFQENRRIIGYITGTEIVWRKKLMHWIGWNSSHNSSNVNLLNLTARHADASKCPFDLILDYLDLNSLTSLSRTCKECEQSVSSYVKRHAQQNGTFIITDEFYCDATELRVFSEYVENLNVYFFHRIFYAFQRMIKNHFKNVRKIRYFSTYHRNSPRDVCMPQVRHLIFIGSGSHDYCDLYEIYCLCPNLEQLEFKSKTTIYAEKNELSFHNLKKIVYKFSNEDQAKTLDNLFEDSGTELIKIE